MSKVFYRVLSSVLSLAVLLASGCSELVSPAAPTEAPQPAESIQPVVSATGIVAPAQWATLSITSAGVIDELLVKEGEKVEAGQVLLRLNGKEDLQAAISAVEFELVSAQHALDMLYEKPDLKEAQAQQAVAQAQRAVDDATRYLNNLRTAAPQVDIDQARANVALAKSKLDKARDKFEPYENKSEDNIIRAGLLSNLTQAQKDYDSAVRRLNNLLGNASDLDIAEAEAELELAKAQLTDAQHIYEDLKGGPETSDVALAQARVDNARTQLDAARAKLADQELKAPFSGVVTELYVRGGEWVTSGQAILLLADLEKLRVETTDLNEIDAARVGIGDLAIVTFDALPDVVVNGKATFIAPKAAQGSGVNYKVIVELDKIPEKLRWGMTAFVDVQVGSQ